MKMIIAVTGASGAIYAQNFLQHTKKLGIETHLIITETARKVIKHELGDPNALDALASFTYKPSNMEAPIASGSFKVETMVIIPATMKTISAIAHGYSENLVIRAADVHLKERRDLILVPRETPIHAIHLENMAKLAKMGAIILPAMPGFYHNPKKIKDLADFISGKILDQLNIPNELFKRWGQD